MSNDTVSLSSLLGSSLLVKGVDGQRSLASLSVLDGKYVGLYFSAHWCPPCRGFTPKLRQIYLDLQKQGKQFEVVFVSSDSNLAEFEEYYGEMPWCAVPYSSSATISALSKRFDVKGIPSLVLLAPDGQVISKNARSAVLRGTDAFPWDGEEDPSTASSFNYRTIVYLLLVMWIIYRFVFSNVWKFKD